MRKNNRAARTLVQFFDSLPNNNVKFPNLRFQRRRELNSKPFFLYICFNGAPRHQSLGSLLCQKYVMQTKWKKSKLLVFAQMFLFKWSNLCRSRRYCLNSITSFPARLRSTSFHLTYFVMFSLFPSPLFYSSYRSIDLFSNTATCSEKDIRRCPARKFRDVAGMSLVLKISNLNL